MIGFSSFNQNDYPSSMLLNSDFTTFQKRFETHLSEMLSADELGAFILVLANSMQDDHLHTALAPQLATTFAALKQRHQHNTLQASDDDCQVFAALLETGIAHYHAWEQKSLSPWRAAFNPFRDLRPQRASRERFATLKRVFDEKRFHFDRPFLKPEILSEERFNGQPIRVLYHKFPFVAYHLLILPDPTGHHPQFMTEWSHQLSWDLTAHAAERIPGFGLAYNSLGASASVNHLHVHGFVETEPFSIENKVWQHNGGDRPYPLQCHPMHSAADSWALIEKLHHDHQPYNLLYRPSVCYVIPRLPQGLRELPQWLPDAGWYELSGAFNLISYHNFDDLHAVDIEAGLSRLKL